MNVRRGGLAIGLILTGLMGLLPAACSSGGSESPFDAGHSDAPFLVYDGRADGPADGGRGPDSTTGADSGASADATLDSASFDSTTFDTGFFPDTAAPDVALGDTGFCTSSSCSPGTTCCELCVDTTTDPNNCGGCFQECDQAATCDQGACVWSSCTVADNSGPCLISPGVHGTCCGGTCKAIDTKTDPANCGGCGNVCPIGSICNNGCTAPDGGFATCMTDGGCPPGDICNPGSQQSCLPTTCGPGSDDNPCGLSPTFYGQAKCCSQTCVDPSSDDNNCGTCGNVCQAGTFCNEGSCAAIVSCAGSPVNTACPFAPNVIGRCCGGACVDYSTDSQNCEQCGAACPNGASCKTGGCGEPDGGLPDCYDQPGTCPAGDVCYGNSCVRLQCAAGVDDGKLCGFGPNKSGTCCGGACVDPTSDPNNCGTCGTVCPSGLCGGGFPGQNACIPPPGGSCQFPCPPGMTCAGGQCEPSACQGPFGSCAATDGNPGACCFLGFGQTCADLGTDVQNCGGCGNVCPQGQTCAGGVCSGTMAPCGAGKIGGYCDLDAGTGSTCCPGTGCIDRSTDKNNCGYCGNVCQGALECVSGNCVATSCTGVQDGQSCLADGGFDPSSECCNGACVSVASDPANCGMCSTKCAGSETCSGGACGVTTCTPATVGVPCHLAEGTGECCTAGCVDTTSDPANCGGCGLTCGDAGACNQGSCH
jgi:hypothetical protein